MADENPLASLNAAELAALAKAQAAGVNLVGKDGNTSNISDATPKAAEAAAAAAAAAKATSGDVDPKAAAAAAAAASKPARPDHVPEKFWDADKGVVNTEALLKSYGELEKNRSKSAESTAEKPASMGDPAAEAAAAAAAAAAAGVKTPAQVAAEVQAERNGAAQAASADIAKDGKISEATYTRLGNAGYTRAVVDEFVAGQKAQAALAVQSLHTTAGGKDSYDKMVAWGTANYTPAEQGAFNAAIRSADAGTREMAVKGLNARYTAEFGKGATNSVNTSNGTPTGNAFRSKAELTAAMQDKRYTKNDAAFHREVNERIQASMRQGIDIGIRIHG